MNILHMKRFTPMYKPAPISNIGPLPNRAIKDERDVWGNAQKNIRNTNVNAFDKFTIGIGPIGDNTNLLKRVFQKKDVNDIAAVNTGYNILLAASGTSKGISRNITKRSLPDIAKKIASFDFSPKQLEIWRSKANSGLNKDPWNHVTRKPVSTSNGNATLYRLDSIRRVIKNTKARVPGEESLSGRWYTDDPLIAEQYRPIGARLGSSKDPSVVTTIKTPIDNLVFTRSHNKGKARYGEYLVKNIDNIKRIGAKYYDPQWANPSANTMKILGIPPKEFRAAQQKHLQPDKLEAFLFGINRDYNLDQGHAIVNSIKI